MLTQVFEMTEPIRLCCDCKFYKRDWISHIVMGSDGLDKCLNPIVNENLVSGKNEGKFCEIQRGSYGGCGRDGKYFEARK
jgi:hypothetical protein